MPTIKHVAREAGVSTATVSYVLNNTGLISDATRSKVLQAVEKLGYRPSVIARGLQARESRMIGYSWRPISPDKFSPIVEWFIHSVGEAAARHDYHLLSFPQPAPADEIPVYAAMIESGRVDAFVLSDTNIDDSRIRYLLDQEFPFVAFGRANSDWEFSWVDVDGAGGGCQAIIHLLKLGHRRIACLAWPAESVTGQHRMDGYVRAMAEAGIAIDPAWLVRIQNGYHESYRATQQLLSLPLDRRPTAVFAFSDLMAMGVMNAADDAGFAVGRDLAVIGFDDAPVAGYLRPPLTSLRQPIGEVGERMVTILIDMVRSQTTEPVQELLSPQLIVRESTDASGR